MANLKEIRRRIKSVKNTKKITYAMKLVSAAKLRKAQDAVTSSRDYTNALSSLLADLANEKDAAEFSHPLMESRPEPKHIRFIVVGGSRGLCGGYNSKLNQKVSSLFQELEAQYPGVEFSSVLVGKKPADYYRHKKIDFEHAYENLPENANLWPVDEICLEIEKAFLSREIDACYLIYTKFQSAMTQFQIAEKLLPMDSDMQLGDEEEKSSESFSGITLFEPSAKEVFQAIIPRILRARVRQAGLDSKASEHGSRMVSMDSATKNAGELIDKLTLKHNKLRQSVITAELLDIIGGAEAIKG